MTMRGALLGDASGDGMAHDARPKAGKAIGASAEEVSSEEAEAASTLACPVSMSSA